MERKDFVNILSLAVTSAFPEVDEDVLYRRDIIHIYFNDDSFMEINVGDSDNASLFVNIWAGLWRDRPSLGEDVPETIATVFRGQIKYNDESYTDIRLWEHEGEDVFVAPYKGLLWVWKWNKMVLTTIPMRPVHGQQ